MIIYLLYIYQNCNLSKRGLLAGVVKKKKQKQKTKTKQNIKHKTQKINNK